MACADSKKREHVLSLTLPLDYPSSSPVVSAHLPENFELPVSMGGALSLSELVGSFEARLKDFELLWDVLDDIDAHCPLQQPQSKMRFVPSAIRAGVSTNGCVTVESSATGVTLYILYRLAPGRPTILGEKLLVLPSAGEGARFRPRHRPGYAPRRANRSPKCWRLSL